MEEFWDGFEKSAQTSRVEKAMPNFIVLSDLDSDEKKKNFKKYMKRRKTREGAGTVGTLGGAIGGLAGYGGATKGKGLKGALAGGLIGATGGGLLGGFGGRSTGKKIGRRAAKKGRSTLGFRDRKKAQKHLEEYAENRPEEANWLERSMALSRDKKSD